MKLMIVIALYNLKGGVGKTASCVNLAYLAAADGYKTLLWDIDPQGSSSFYYKVKPKTHPGIKKLIAKDAVIENAILSTDFELLDVIPADNSSKSIDVMLEEMKHSKNKIKNVLKPLSEEYDFVFIDCPPIEVVADTPIYEQFADRTIFVVRAGLMERSMLPEIDALYKEKKFKNMTLILNGTKARGGRYGSHYGYGYGYGYGYNYNKEKNGGAKS